MNYYTLWTAKQRWNAGLINSHKIMTIPAPTDDIARIKARAILSIRKPSDANFAWLSNKQHRGLECFEIGARELAPED